MHSLSQEVANSRPHDQTPHTIPVIWQERGLGLVRIAFGLNWAIDAWFKWQPAFLNHVTSQLTATKQAQPAPIQEWVAFWAHITSINPHAFAVVEAIMETAIAAALLLGAFTNLTTVGGAFLSFFIWSTAEGFGGPYNAGSVNTGTSIIYVLVFATLFLTSAGRYLGVDRVLTSLLGRWGFLASGPALARPMPSSGRRDDADTDT